MTPIQTRETEEAGGGDQGDPGVEGARIPISPSRLLREQNEKSSLLNHKAIKKLKIS